MIATLVEENIGGWMGETNLYRLSPPYQGYGHVAVMSWPVQYGQWQSSGVEVVGCNEDGVAPQMTALWSNYELLDHRDVLAALGYTLTD